MSDDEGVGGDPSDFEEGAGADASDPDERVDVESEAGTADEGGRTAAADDVEPMDVETADPEEVERLRRRVEAFEESIEERTVHRDEVEGDLQRYVRRKLRRGHARGWGPYLVLLYGTLMTLGAFYFLQGIWAILAMVVVWLSTLGLYTLMLLVGWIGTAIGIPGRLRDRVQDIRD